MYETGLFVALLLWAWSSIWLLIMINSRMERNLRHAGMCLSWSTLRPRQRTDSDRKRGAFGAVFKYAVIVLLGLAMVLLSWMYVAIVGGMFLYRRQKDLGQPVAVREFNWKMRNLEMGFDQVAKELHALNAAIGLEPPAYERFRDDLWATAAGR